MAISKQTMPEQSSTPTTYYLNNAHARLHWSHNSQITQLVGTTRIGGTFRGFAGLSLRILAQGVRPQTHFRVRTT